MIGTTDRLLEETLANLIDFESFGIQCLPNLLAGGDAFAKLPRIIVYCESQESPDFAPCSDGIYNLYPVRTIISSIAEATNPLCYSHLTEMDNAVDRVIEYNGGLLESLNSSALETFGIVLGRIVQERNGNRLMRHRDLTIWSRVQAASAFIIDDTTGGQVVDDITGLPIVSD